MEYVYFIQHDNPKSKGSAPVKIGMSKDPDARLRELQTGSSHKLKLCVSLLCFSRDEAVRLEKALHWVAGRRGKRLSGEWFILNCDWSKVIHQAMNKCGSQAIRA